MRLGVGRWELGGGYPQQNTSGDRFPWGMFNKTLRTGTFTRQLPFAGRWIPSAPPSFSWTWATELPCVGGKWQNIPYFFQHGTEKGNSSQRPVTVHWKQGTRVGNYYQKSDLFLPLENSPGKIDLISQCRWEGGLEPVFFFFLIIREKKKYVLGFGFHQRLIYKFIISRISQWLNGNTHLKDEDWSSGVVKVTHVRSQRWDFNPALT